VAAVVARVALGVLVAAAKVAHQTPEEQQTLVAQAAAQTVVLAVLAVLAL
jgi:hypothetical protein